MRLDIRGRVLDLGAHSAIMGILNVTPDSFYDGGRYAGAREALARARAMAEEGADIIDIGGESTRPGSGGVTAGEEIERVAPVVEAVAKEVDIAISIDTRKAAVAGTALNLGAHLVNDVSGFRHDPAMAGVVAGSGAGVVLMHMRGTPGDMQERTDYGDVVRDVKHELLERVAAAQAAGVDRDKILIDPGIGFSKTAEQSAELIARVDEFVDSGYPVLLGPSRKSFMGKMLGLEAEDRLEATIATCIWAVLKGVRVVRVHDVEPAARALKMVRAIAVAGGGRKTKVAE